MSRNELAVIISSMLFGFLIGVFAMQDYYEWTAIEAKVAYYDPITADFKYKYQEDYDLIMKRYEENKDEI